MSLISELKRRNVIRMAGLYLVAAWLVLQSRRADIDPPLRWLSCLGYLEKPAGHDPPYGARRSAVHG